MKVLRSLVILVIAGALVGAFLVDGQDRSPAESLLDPAADTAVDTSVWFCPGGSAPGGVAEVGLDLINVGSTAATAIVTGVRSGSGAEPRDQIESIDVGERRLVRLADLVADSAWMGAVVEVTAGDLLVEQAYVGANTDSDRAPCHLSTSRRWVVPSGATRVAERGETQTILVLNPFLDDAVLDVHFDADVGVDSLTGVVAPARRVTAIDVTDAVTVAGRVSSVIEVIAGQVAVTRVQAVEDETQLGLSVTPGSPELAPVWFLPIVHRDARRDVITVVNPSETEEAKVDLEIVADGTITFDPIELTLRPGRVVTVDLADEARLEGLETMSVVARSLPDAGEAFGPPVAVMNESFLPFGDGPQVSNLSATVGSSVAATRWMAAIENDEGGLILFNPGDGIVTATVSELVDGEPTTVVEVELGGGRRAEVAAEAFATERPLVVVDAPAPVVVGREFAGLSVHAQLMAIPLDGVVALG